MVDFLYNVLLDSTNGDSSGEEAEGEDPDEEADSTARGIQSQIERASRAIIRTPSSIFA